MNSPVSIAVIDTFRVRGSRSMNGKKEQVLTNARIVTRDSIIEGTVWVTKGTIRAVGTGSTSVPGKIDFDGDYLLPGLIEMHTDSLEKHLIPRPGIMWPSFMGALLAHDTQISGAGITTVLDAIFIGDYHKDGMRRQILKNSISAIREAREKRLLRADHMLHLRCEISDAAVLDMFAPYADDPLVRLISVMDHTPGQRQWSNLERYRQFHRDKKWTDEEFRQSIADRIAIQQKHAHINRREILKVCKEKNLPVASHDDTTDAHSLESARDGIAISEFPTTLEAAQKAKELGMHVIMGAPNLVRGNSHSGNVSAAELAQKNLLDGLSSDYFPSSLLHASFLLHQQHRMSLPSAVAKVTANIADLLKLKDRGEIAPGKRADLTRVGMCGDLPVVRALWKAGAKVF